MDRFIICTENTKWHRLKITKVLITILFLFISIICNTQKSYINVNENCCKEISEYFEIQNKEIFLDSLSVKSVLHLPLSKIDLRNDIKFFLDIFYGIDSISNNDEVGKFYYVGKLANASFESNNHHLILFYLPKFHFSNPDCFSLFLFNVNNKCTKSIVEVAIDSRELEFITYSKYKKLDKGEILIENISYPHDEDLNIVKNVKYFKIDLLGKIEEIPND